MTVVAALAAAAVIGGLSGYLAVTRTGAVDLTAPRLRSRVVRRTVLDHPRLRRLLARHPHAGTVMGVVLAALAVAAVVALAAVTLLLALVRTGLAGTDAPVARWAAAQATDTTTDVLRAVTWFGGTDAVVAGAVLVALWSVRHGPALPVAAFLATSVGGQFAIVNAVKWVVDRARPEELQLTGFAGASFPSGHAAAAATSYAAFALVLGSRSGRRTRTLLATTAGALAVAVAATRPLLGVHWASDALAGLLVGWAWFAVSSIVFGGRLLHFAAPVELAEEVADRAEPERR